MTDKITIEEFEVCDNFAYDIQFIFPLLDRKFILISHIVSCDEFVILLITITICLVIRLKALFKK